MVTALWPLGNEVPGFKPHPGAFLMEIQLWFLSCSSGFHLLKYALHCCFFCVSVLPCKEFAIEVKSVA